MCTSKQKIHSKLRPDLRKWGGRSKQWRKIRLRELARRFFGSVTMTPSSDVLQAEFLKHGAEPPARQATGSQANDYSGVLLSSSREIRLLKDAARRLLERDEATLDPEFFLASLTPGGCAPRVVTVYRAGVVVGIMYAKERIIFRVPTGIVYADGSLGGFLLANGPHRHNVFIAAMETLLSSAGIRGIRLRLLGGGADLEAINQLAASRPLDVEYSPVAARDSEIWKPHAQLSLAETYERFLSGLGSTTRHNFRYYRRRFEQAGHRFIHHLSKDELYSATVGLAPKSPFTSQWQPRVIRRALNMVAATRRPLAVGLRHHNGEWLSVIGGWYRSDGAVLNFQCNNECDFGPDSLSLVLRAYLIELLIRQGMNELIIWGGTGPPLSRYVSYAPAMGVHLDIPTYLWRTARLLISAIGPRLPKRLADAAQWIT